MAELTLLNYILLVYNILHIIIIAFYSYRFIIPVYTFYVSGKTVTLLILTIL